MASVRRKKPSMHSSFSYFCQRGHVFMLLKLDAGVYPSTLSKPRNKWRKQSTSTKYAEPLGKKNAQQWSLIHFPYMCIQPDFSVYGMKSQNPGFKIETSGKESQDSSNPRWTFYSMASFKCISVFPGFFFFFLVSTRARPISLLFANWNRIHFWSL